MTQPLPQPPKDVLDIARALRSSFGAGVRLLSVEFDDGQQLGKLPAWWPEVAHLDAAAITHQPTPTATPYTGRLRSRR